jgi:hypothetical protein
VGPARQRVVSAHFEHVRRQADPVLLSKEARAFAAAYPAEKDRIAGLSGRLFGLLHQAVDDAVRDAALTAEAKKQRLDALDPTLCEPAHAAYLKDVLQQAQAHAKSNEPADLWAYERLWRAPPVPSLKPIGPPSVSKITLRSIDVALSDPHFRELQGTPKGDASPAVEVWWKGGARLVPRVVGPVNQRTFSVALKKGDQPLTLFVAADSVAEVFVKDHNDQKLLLKKGNVAPPQSFEVAGKALQVAAPRPDGKRELRHRFPNGTTAVLTFDLAS